VSPTSENPNTTEQPQTKSGSKDDPKPDATGKRKADVKRRPKATRKANIEERPEVNTDGQSTVFS